MISNTEAQRMLEVALAEAQSGFDQGGVPVGAALFSADGELLGRGHNRRVQDGHPAFHGETAAFTAAGRRRDYRDTVMVTTLAPCLFCTGLVRQFNIGTVVVGESRNFAGGVDELRAHGVEVLDLDDQRCVDLLVRFMTEKPEVWNEDIGVSD